MGSRNLATSGMRWGVSCEVENEAQLGVVIGYMKLFGGSAIGFEPLGKAQRAKSPKHVAAGKLGGRRKGSRNHERGSLLVEARRAISKLSPEWGKPEFNRAMSHFSISARSRALALLVVSKEISRAKGRGRYRTNPKIVEASAGVAL